MVVVFDGEEVVEGVEVGELEAGVVAAGALAVELDVEVVPSLFAARESVL